MSIAREVAQPVGPGFAPYVWAPAIDEVAVRHGMPREAVLKFDLGGTPRRFRERRQVPPSPRAWPA